MRAGARLLAADSPGPPRTPAGAGVDWQAPFASPTLPRPLAMSWNGHLTFGENVHVNFDRYYPPYAWRRTEEELRRRLCEAGFAVVRGRIEASGITRDPERVRDLSGQVVSNESRHDRGEVASGVGGEMAAVVGGEPWVLGKVSQPLATCSLERTAKRAPVHPALPAFDLMESGPDRHPQGEDVGPRVAPAPDAFDQGPGKARVDAVAVEEFAVGRAGTCRVARCLIGRDPAGVPVVLEVDEGLPAQAQHFQNLEKGEGFESSAEKGLVSRLASAPHGERRPAASRNPFSRTDRGVSELGVMLSRRTPAPVRA